MPNTLVIAQDQATIKGLKKTLVKLQNGWKFEYINSNDRSLSAILDYLYEREIHFIIYTTPLNALSINYLSKLYEQYPLIFFIYYYCNLRNGQFFKLYELGIQSCIIGNNRQSYLIKTLPKLWKSHWRRIPEPLYLLNAKPASLKTKKILSTIESKPLKECYAKSLAKHLNISESYFRSQFKNFFGMSFREFKQNLFAHYESELLITKKLRPTDIYKSLNYGSIANFSRSFKTRHRYSYRNYIQRYQTTANDLK